MAKNRIGLLFLLIVLLSCRNKLQREVAYYPDGAIRLEVTLVNGKREGLGIDYFQNGKVKGRSFWKNGMKEGEETIFYEDGVKRKVSSYVEGKCQISKDYNRSGSLEEIRVYDSLARVTDYLTYKTDGTRDFGPGTKDPIFIVEMDTVKVGEDYKALIRLGNRQFDHVDVVIGDIQDSLILKTFSPLPRRTA